MRKVMMIAIARIDVPEKRIRTFDERKMVPLVTSIQERGLQSPILVMPTEKDGIRRYRLVAGHNRLRAMAKLGKTVIPAFIVKSPAEAKMLEIEENFARVDLTELERAEHLVRYVLAKEGISVAKLKDVRDSLRWKVSVASRKIDLPNMSKEARRKSLERALKIFAIRRKVKDAVREAGLDNYKAALLAIANEKGIDAQMRKVEEFKTKKKRAVPPERTGATGKQLQHRQPNRVITVFEDLTHAWEASSLYGLWKNAQDKTRMKFATWLCPDLERF